MAARP